MGTYPQPHGAYTGLPRPPAEWSSLHPSLCSRAWADGSESLQWKLMESDCPHTSFNHREIFSMSQAPDVFCLWGNLALAWVRTLKSEELYLHFRQSTSTLQLPAVKLRGITSEMKPRPWTQHLSTFQRKEASLLQATTCPSLGVQFMTMLANWPGHWRWEVVRDRRGQHK